MNIIYIKFSYGGTSCAVRFTCEDDAIFRRDTNRVELENSINIPVDKMNVLWVHGAACPDTQHIYYHDLYDNKSDIVKKICADFYFDLS